MRTLRPVLFVLMAMVSWLRFPAAAACMLFLAYCGDSASLSPFSGDTGCVTDLEFFQREVLAKVISPGSCAGCHGDGGTAVKDYNLQWSLGYDTATNFNTFQALALRDSGGSPLLLTEPTLANAGGNAAAGHVGGIRVTPVGGCSPGDSQPYCILEEFVNRSRNPVVCNKRVDDNILRGVVLEDYAATYRRAALSLAGRTVTSEEEAEIYNGGESAFNQKLTELMNEEGFYERLREMFNEVFLTEYYSAGDRGAFALDESIYPQRLWYVNRSSEAELRGRSNRGFARAPLYLITDIVRNNRPITEILTANYQMVNPYYARMLGLTGSWVYPDGGDLSRFPETDYRKVQLRESGRSVPHAGILTDKAFLSRYPDSDTNVNRHRSRKVFEFFFDGDILLLSMQLNATDIAVDNPTLQAPECTVCHVVMDPIAGLFKNYRNGNVYRPAEWFDVTGNRFTKMLPPGFSASQTLPASDNDRSLAWLGGRLAKDPRFARSIVRMMIRGITGHKQILDARTDERLAAQGYQKKFVDYLAGELESSGYNLKTVIREIIKSPAYRGRNAREVSPGWTANATGSPSVVPQAIQVTGTSSLSARTELLGEVGTGRLLSPEQLNRKLKAIFGFTWTSGSEELLIGRHRLLYGGIDSDRVTVRVTRPNAIMSNIQMSMAVDMACRATARDFAITSKDNRRLFPEVQASFQPDGGDGAILGIQKNLAHLHRIILGERISTAAFVAGHPTWDLFEETYLEYKMAGSTSLPWNCQARSSELGPGTSSISADRHYTLHAWMAVLSYLMSDYNFVYE